jgi:hypothetical protein
VDDGVGLFRLVGLKPDTKFTKKKNRILLLFNPFSLNRLQMNYNRVIQSDLESTIYRTSN